MILINLLEKKSKLEMFLSLFNVLYVELALFLLAVIITISISTITSKNLNYELSIITMEKNKLYQQLLPLQNTKVKISNYDKNKKALLKKINTVLHAKRKVSIYFNVLSKIEESTPDDCWITSFNYSTSKSGINMLNIKINTLRASSINQFITNMKVSAIFENIMLEKVEKDSEVDKKKQFIVDIHEFNVKAKIPAIVCV